MSERIRFPVSAVGIGRQDYSQNLEYSVEPVIRSHLQRINWWFTAAGWPTVPFPFVYLGDLVFEDRAGVVTNICPSDVEYYIYDVWNQGLYNALTPCLLYKYTLVPFALVEVIGLVYGYQKASLHFTSGVKCEPGFTYVVCLAQYSELPTFTASMIVHGLTDRVIYEE